MKTENRILELTPEQLANMPRERRARNPYMMSLDQLSTHTGKSVGALAYARRISSSSKNIARHQVLRLFEIKRWPGPLSMLTMPATDWFFEKNLLRMRHGQWQAKVGHAMDTVITSVELDPMAYAAASVAMPKKAYSAICNYSLSPAWCAHLTGSDGISRFYCCDVFNLMRFENNSFDAAWLDFTGPMTSDKLKTIAEFYNHRIKGIFVLTFLGARQPFATTMEITEAGGFLSWLKQYLPGHLIHFLSYNDCSPMLQFAIKKEDAEFGDAMDIDGNEDEYILFDGLVKGIFGICCPSSAHRVER